MRILRKILYIFLFAAGVAIFLYPDANAWLNDKENSAAIEAFREEAAEEGTEETEETEETESTYDFIHASEALWESIQVYNQSLYENGQETFRDAWTVAQSPTSINGLDGTIFGYIEIPAMDVELPLYIGASTENLSKGAAVLGATSIPVGGENTNSVIAGHRGYRGIPFFREIEKISVGDAVYITNPWGTLGYRVESIDIINPDDSGKVMIQEGRDMVTLMTCHPYRSHGKYRYVVYCVRDDSVLDADYEPAATETTGDTISSTDGYIYETSQGDIDRESLFRRVCGAALLIFLVVCLLAGRRKNRN